MGQKVNPHGARVGVIHDWDTRWYSTNTIKEPQAEASLSSWTKHYYQKFLHLKETMTASMKEQLKKPYMKLLIKLLI